MAAIGQAQAEACLKIRGGTVPPMRLLLIEDDDILGEGLRDFLRSDGHVVDWCTTLESVRAMSMEPFDAWLVDWQLPDGSGLDWLRAQRARGNTTLALVMTARDQLHQRVEGLDAGADDYLVKPFAPEELSARLRAFNRRRSNANASMLQIGPVAIDLAARTAWTGGVRVNLTGREWAVLEALVLRSGKVVPKNDLERLVLGFESELASNAMEVHVSALRKKLGSTLIETVRGLGYRLGNAV